MDDEKILNALNDLLDKSKTLNPYNKKDVDSWWNTVRFSLFRMGSHYSKEASNINFNLHGSIDPFESEDERRLRIAEDRQKHIDEVVALLDGVIKEIEMFGLAQEDEQPKTTSNTNSNVNVSVTQNQSSNTIIKLSDYDSKTQECLTELLFELKAERRDKNKIKKLLSKLADVSIEILIKLFTSVQP